MAELERDFWFQVEEGLGDELTVEYAADLDTTEVGSGFGRPGQKLVDPR